MTKTSNRKDPNLKDLAGEMIPCPLCNKAIVLARPEHSCDRLLKDEEYINDKLGLRLLWTPDRGWRSYHYPEGDVIEDLSFADVVNWTQRLGSFVPINQIEEV